jgi:hypothetical protein
MRRECPTCGRLIYLNREGPYRRHFGAQPGGSVRLCATSGQAPPDVGACATPPRPVAVPTNGDALSSSNRTTSSTRNFSAMISSPTWIITG